MSSAHPSNNSKDCEGNLSYTSIGLLCVILLYPYFWCTPVTKYFRVFFRIPLTTFLRCPEVNGGVWMVKGLILNLDRQFPMVLFLRVFKTKWKVFTKNKKDNPRFIDEETIQLVQDKELDTSEATSTLQLRRKVKRGKISALYRHLNVAGDPGLADIDRFMIKKFQKQVTLPYIF